MTVWKFLNWELFFWKQYIRIKLRMIHWEVKTSLLKSNDLVFSFIRSLCDNDH